MTASSSDPEKNAKLAAKVLATGHVVRADEGAYFVPTSGGAIAVASSAFAMQVSAVCATAPRSQTTRAVAGLIEARAFQNPNVVRVTHSHDALAVVGGEEHYLVNCGRGRVVEVCPDGSRIAVPNGCYGVLFLDAMGFEPVEVTDEHLAWNGSDGSSYIMRLIIDRLPPPAGDLTVREVGALALAAWFTPFLSSLITGKPIWLFLGGPGVGKTVTQRGMAKAFYGASGNTSGGMGGDRAGKDIFAAAAHQPVVLRDDVNRVSADTMDSFCQLATGMKLMMASLYEDLTLAQFEVKATFIFSAFAPRWLGRLDVMQRLLTIEFARPTSGDGPTESARMREILDARPWIWAETMLVLAQKLHLPKPSSSPIRFDDWYGYMRNIMTAYGYEKVFDTALAKLDEERIRIACGANPEVAALRALASNPFWGQNWSLAAQFVDAIAANDGVRTRDNEPHRATGVLRDPQRLSLFLMKVMSDYSGVVTVVRREGPDHKNVYRLWPAGQPDPLAETEPATAGTEHRAQ